MKWQGRIVGMLMVWMGTGTVYAQPPSFRLSVDDLFRLGIENSVSLKRIRVEEEVADAQLQSAKAGRLPDVSVGIAGGAIGQPVVFRQGLSQPTRPETPDWSQSYSVEVSQPLYQGGRISSGIQRGKIRRRIAALNTRDNQENIKLLLLERYLNLFTLYKRKDVLARNIEESNRRLADIRRMKAEGLLTRNDELRSELQLTNDKLDYSETEHQILLESQDLDILLGIDETLLLVPDTTLLEASLRIDSLDRYITTAYACNTQMKLAEANTRLAQTDVKTARADLLPSLSLVAGNTLARPVSSTMDDYYNNTWSIGLSLSYNLSSLYRGRHRVKEARYGVQTQSYAEELQRQSIRSNVRSAYIRHREALERVTALVLSVSQARENYRIVRNRYMNQLSILTDLIDASSVLLDAELQLVSAKVQTVYTYYKLQRICGLL